MIRKIITRHFGELHASGEAASLNAGGSGSPRSGLVLAPRAQARLAVVVQAHAHDDGPAADLAVLDVVLVAGAFVDHRLDRLAAIRAVQVEPARHQRTGKS